MTDDLLADLTKAEAETRGEVERICPLCDYIRATEDEATREALRSAAAGSIGSRKFTAVLQKHQTGIGRRTVIRHRNERHEP